MNWGKGIMIALIGFIAFITTLGVKMMRADADLVSEDYYIKEVKYGNEITAQQNARSSNAQLTKETSSDGILLTILSGNVDSGQIHLRRSNDPSLDLNFELKGENIFIEKDQLKTGKYDVLVDWNHENKTYQIRDILWIP